MIKSISKIIASVMIMFSMMQSSQGAEDVPQESSYRKPLVVIGSVAAVAAAIAVPVALVYSSAPTGIELHDVLGNTLYYPDLTSGLGSNQSFSFFEYITPMTECTLGCIDGLAGACKTLFFSSTESGVSTDCMTHIVSNDARLVDAFWNSGKSVMSFWMTKRA